MNASTLSLGLRSTMYALTPQETYAEHLKDSLNLLPMALVLTMTLALLEGVVAHALGRGKEWSVHDVLSNTLTATLFIAFNTFFLRGVDIAVYIWCYNNINIFSLPWDSLRTYVVATLGVDFCTYWWHRASHEFAFMWAAHSSHHSSEYYNISISNRISLFMKFVKWLYFVPMAVVGVPPSVFVVHAQMNFIFGFWGHSLVIPKMTKILPGLGHIIEFIISTPSNHRVHHGVNKYCMDKNYGSLLIIWDRIFGTYTEEREDEPIVYGTTKPLETFDVMKIQVEPFQKLYQKMQGMKTTGDKVRTLVFGPAWTPGKPRLGDEADIPDVRGRRRRVVSLPLWLTIYMGLQVALLVFVFREMSLILQSYGEWEYLANLSLILSSCTALGGMYDGQLYTLWVEPLRLLLLAVAGHLYPIFSSPTITNNVSAFCLASLLFWPALKAYFLPPPHTKTSTHNGFKKET